MDVPEESPPDVVVTSPSSSFTSCRDVSVSDGTFYSCINESIDGSSDQSDLERTVVSSTPNKMQMKDTPNEGLFMSVESMPGLETDTLAAGSSIGISRTSSETRVSRDEGSGASPAQSDESPRILKIQSSVDVLDDSAEDQLCSDDKLVTERPFSDVVEKEESGIDILPATSSVNVIGSSENLPQHDVKIRNSLSNDTTVSIRSSVSSIAVLGTSSPSQDYTIPYSLQEGPSSADEVYEEMPDSSTLAEDEEGGAGNLEVCQELMTMSRETVLTETSQETMSLAVSPTSVLEMPSSSDKCLNVETPCLEETEGVEVITSVPDPPNEGTEPDKPDHLSRGRTLNMDDLKSPAGVKKELFIKIVPATEPPPSLSLSQDHSSPTSTITNTTSPDELSAISPDTSLQDTLPPTDDDVLPHNVTPPPDDTDIPSPSTAPPHHNPHVTPEEESPNQSVTPPNYECGASPAEKGTVTTISSLPSGVTSPSEEAVQASTAEEIVSSFLETLLEEIGLNVEQDIIEETSSVMQNNTNFPTDLPSEQSSTQRDQQEPAFQPCDALPEIDDMPSRFESGPAENTLTSTTEPSPSSPAERSEVTRDPPADHSEQPEVARNMYPEVVIKPNLQIDLSDLEALKMMEPIEYSSSVESTPDSALPRIRRVDQTDETFADLSFESEVTVQTEGTATPVYGTRSSSVISGVSVPDSVHISEDHPASDLFISRLAGVLPKDDVIYITTKQKYMLNKMECTNEKLRSCNNLSAAQYEKVAQNLRYYTKLLVEMRRDVDTAFKRIHSIKGKLELAYPAIWNKVSQEVVTDYTDPDEEEQEQCASTHAVPSTTKTYIIDEDDISEIK